MDKRHLVKLDLLRGIAIILVFLFHAQEILYPQFFDITYNSHHLLNVTSFKKFILYFSPTSYGFTGVHLFLIISGFVIHYNYLITGNVFNFKKFITKRFWRIYPPYLLTLIFFSISGVKVYYYLFTSVGLKLFFTHLLLIQNLSDKSFFAINGSLWSLALEVQLYLLYPVFLYLIKRFGLKKTALAILVLSLAFLIVSLPFPLLKNSPSYQYSAPSFWFIWVSGAYCADLYFNKKRLIRGNNIWYVLISMFLLLFSKYFFYAYFFVFFLATAFWLTFLDYVLFSTRINNGTLFSKSLIFIGLCSYSMYLIHQPYLAHIIDSVSLVSANSEFKFLNVILPLIIIILISYSIYLLVELKSINIGRSFINRNTKLKNQVF